MSINFNRQLGIPKDLISWIIPSKQMLSKGLEMSKNIHITFKVEL